MSLAPVFDTPVHEGAGYGLADSFSWLLAACSTSGVVRSQAETDYKARLNNSYLWKGELSYRLRQPRDGDRRSHGANLQERVRVRRVHIAQLGVEGRAQESG